MSGLIEGAEAAVGAAVSPYSIWLKVAAWAIGAAVLIGIGWAAHDAFDGTKAAKAETAVARCEGQSETNRADLNGAAVAALASGGAAAAGADRRTNGTETPRKSGYAAAQQEASNVPTNPTPAICLDPEPLRQLFIGMRNTDASAAAKFRGDGGEPAAVQHQLPLPAVPR